MKKENEVKQCTIILTRDCNLRCEFCFAKRGGYNKKDFIQYSKLKKIVDFCCEAKVKYIFLTGGEPLSYPYLIEILKYIKERSHPISVAIATNGILLKDEIFCNRLVNNGVSYIDVSIKGGNKNEWYNTTKYNGFEEQQKGIRNLASTGIEFTCSMVITVKNVFSFCEYVKMACENGAKQFSFTFIIDNNNEVYNDLEYLKKNDPIALIDSFITQVEKLNSITTNWWVEYSFPLCLYTKKQLKVLEGKLSSPCQIHMRNAITFNTGMELLPCDMYLFDRLGKFGEDFNTYQDFLSLTTKEDYRNIMEKLQRLPSKECTTCEYLERCYGGCPVLWKNYSFKALKKFKEYR